MNPSTKQSQKATVVDVAIVGAGLVGVSLAVAMGRAGLNVAIFDRNAPSDMIKEVFDGRVTAISYASWQLFKAIGVSAPMEAEGQPINNIRVSDGDAPVFLDFDHRALGTDPLGLMVENRFIRSALFEGLNELKSVTLYAPAVVADVIQDGGLAEIILKDGMRFKSSLVVAADGRASPLREAAGIRTIGAGYNQMGIVTTIEHEKDNLGIAHERFLTPGPFAILPLKGNRSSLVWAEKPQTAKALLALGEEAFDREIAERTGGFLGAVHAVGPRFSYPFSVQIARRYVSGRLVIIGDAAHGIHPIAGQGVNLGWRDVAALAELAVDASRLGLDIGAPDLLARYERWRRTDTITLTAITDTLTRLFSNDIKPLRRVRDIGLAAVNRMPPVKRFLMRHARGTVGSLPRLLKGEAL